MLIKKIKKTKYWTILGGVSKSFKGNYTCRPGANGLFADPSSCSIYHWCVVGILHSTHFCSPGLHFSASASGCVLPNDAECKYIARCTCANICRFSLEHFMCIELEQNVIKNTS